MAVPGRYGRNFWGTDTALQNVIAQAGGTGFAMAALNSGLCWRVTAPDTRDIASVYINWSVVSSPGQVTLRIETIDATTGKPSGTLYDANATLAFTPVLGWQQITFATLPTTGLVAGAEYAIVLLTTTGGTTQTIRAYGSGVGKYPTSALTAADGTTRTNFAEVANSVPILSVVFEDAVEETLGCIPLAGPAVSNNFFTTSAVGMYFTVPAGVSFVVQGYAALVFTRVGTPAGDLRARIHDSTGAVVAGTTVSWDKDSLAGASGRAFGGQLPAPVTLAAGTYRLAFDSAASANSSNCWRLSSVSAHAAGLVPSGFALTATADNTANPIVWTDTATALCSAALVLDDITPSGDYPTAANVRSGTAFNFGATTGTLAVPNPNTVLSPTATDATTGTLTLPTAAQALLGVTFGVGGTGTTGTVTLPSVNDVRFNTTFGASLGSTGTVTLPAITLVVLGTQYGAGGTEFTGTFAGGSCDYPAESDVRAGVVYASGADTGTYDPFAPAASRGLDLSRDWALIDSPVTVSYAVKTAEGVFATPVDVTYCQRNAITKADLHQHPNLLEKDASVFHMWTAKLGTIVPKIADKLSHNSAVWVVEEVGMCDRDANGVQRYRLIVLRSRGAQTL